MSTPHSYNRKRLIGYIILLLVISTPARAERYLNLGNPVHTDTRPSNGLGTLGAGMQYQNYPYYLYPTTPYSGAGPGNGLYPYSNFPSYPYYAY